MTSIFKTVSFHLVKPCNMKCKFCYATFQDIKVIKQLSLENSIVIVNKLISAGVKKITFAGGEPLLYKHIKELLIHTKSKGITTSIITNGSLLTNEWLSEMSYHLDWIGLSIDSLNKTTNESIGRTANTHHDYPQLISLIQKYKYKLKINTVVNIHNQHELMSEFITKSKTTRWKVFDTLKVEGQNEKQFDNIKSTDFKGFVKKNKHPAMVVESNELMTGSYLLIDPVGRLFENSSGEHTYSDSLTNNTMSHCLNQITLNKETFLKRGGIYNW